MITTINEWKELNEANDPLYLLKKNSDGSMDYMIFTDLDGTNTEIEKGRVGNKNTSKTKTLTNKVKSMIRHQKLRGFKEVSSLDVKHVGKPSTGSQTTQANTGGFNISNKSSDSTDLLNTLSTQDAHSVNVNLVGNNIATTTTTGTVKALSVDLVNQYKEYLNDLETFVNNNNRGKYNSTLIKMNNIIKRKQSIGQIFVKNDSDLANDLQFQKDLFNEYLVVTETEFENLDTKSIKDEIADSVVLTSINNMTDLILEDVPANEMDEINKLITTATQWDNNSWSMKKVFKLTNFKTQKRFDNHISKTKNPRTRLLFHGSETRNWLSILKNGLDKKYSGKSHKGDNLFGKGIYFTESVDKGLGYVDSGVFGQGNSQKKYVAIFDVHLGNVTTYKNIPNNDRGDINGPYGSNKYGQIEIDKWILNTDYDSYYGASKHEPDPDPRYPLRRPEFVIYRNEQCTIKYIMEIEI